MKGPGRTLSEAVVGQPELDLACDPASQEDLPRPVPDERLALREVHLQVLAQLLLDREDRTSRRGSEREIGLTSMSP